MPGAELVGSDAREHASQIIFRLIACILRFKQSEHWEQENRTAIYLFRNTLVCSEALELKRDVQGLSRPQEHLWVGAGRGGVKHVLLQSCKKLGHGESHMHSTEALAI